MGHGLSQPWKSIKPLQLWLDFFLAGSVNFGNFPMTISQRTQNSRYSVLGKQAYSLQSWLDTAGFLFNPFLLLEASADSRLSSYLVGHEAFSAAWGNWHSFVFAPAGGGKTALRVHVAQSCWVGQDINRPFPILYSPPFLKWGHVTPVFGDHLAALVESGALSLLLILVHRPHWFLRLGVSARQKVSTILDWCLPGSLESYLQPCLGTKSLEPLSGDFPAAFLPPEPPQAEILLEFCHTILSPVRSRLSVQSIEDKWNALIEILLKILQVPEVYILLDGIDSIQETASDPIAAAACLSPLLDELPIWAERHIYLKAFLPEELYETVLSWQSLPKQAHSIKIHWTPDLLAEVVRRRIYVASQGVYNSLSPLAAPDLRDIEILLAREVIPLPREMLVITQRVLTEWTKRQSESPRIELVDVEHAIGWYKKNRPDIF